MNKLTKVLSVFLLAGALGASVAGVTACKKGGDGGTTPSGTTHETSHQLNYAKKDKDEHTVSCKVPGCDYTAHPEGHTWGANDTECPDCHEAKPTTEHKHDYDWTNNGDGTHSGTCDVEGCDKPEITNEAHHWGENHRCIECNVKQPAYNITFNMHDIGAAPEAQEVYEGDMIEEPEKPANTEAKYFAGWYASADYTGGRFDFSKPASKTVELHARWLDIIEISTAEQLAEFRTTQANDDGTGGLAGAYVLTKDIDMSGVTLEASTAVITDGVVFDGNGHRIINASYNDAVAKSGILCKTVNGGVVTNVKFLNCAASGTAETVGLLAGTAEGMVEISKVEFNSCTVTSGNYGGLVFGRNEKTGLVANISEITTKNGCTVDCSQYGGLLVGDIVGTGSAAHFKNLHIDGALSRSSGNGALIAGRTRAGSVVSVENAVISAEIANGTNNAIFSGNGACAELTIKNVLVIKSNSALVAKTAATKSEIDGLYVLDGVTVTGSTGTGENTVAWLTAHGFDFENVWMAEGEGGYRLKAASTNVKSADAKLETLKISTNNAKVRFKKGEDFVATGLSVMGSYDDGVQLVLKEGVEYSVVSTDYDKTAIGTYTITVHAIEEGATAEDVTYSVTVVEETGFEINHEFIPHVYLRGSKLDTSNLVLYSVWSDGAKEKVAAKDIKVNAESYNMTTAGSYNVQVSYGSYTAQTVTISVIDSKVVPVDGKLYINVDPTAVASTYSGAQVNGVETFANVADAIDYLEACKLDKNVQKVIRIAAGEYKAKITTDLDNLTLIGLGANVDDVKLTYDAVESTVDPLTGAGYAMNCATFHVNGSGFKAYNVFFENSFDYINDSAKESSPQGFALTINGDGAVIENCHLYGNQDTLFLRNGRAYFKTTQIDGNVDFIFGENTGLAYFDHCTIKAISRYTTANSNNGYVTAMKGDPDNKPDYGYIFDSCDFIDDGSLLVGSMSLGRPWGKAATVAMINCSFTAAYSTHGFKTDLQTNSSNYIKGRWEEMSGNSPVNAYFVEYGSTGEGAITTAADNFGGKVLTEAQAANYTSANLFAATNGGVTWSAAWSHTDALALLHTLNGALATEAGDLYVSAESVEVAEESTVELLISNTPWNLDDKGLDIVVADTSIATYGCGEVTGVAEGTTTITVSKDDQELKVINVTVTAKDPTLRDSVNYVYADADKHDHSGTDDGAAVEGIKKVTFSDIVVNNSWAKWKDDNAFIKFTALKGTVITITVSGSETLVFNTTEVAAVEKVVTYTVPEDGEVVIKRKSDTSAYLRTVSINVPITTKYEYNYPYANDTTDVPEQNSALENAPIYFTDARYNSDWLKIVGKIELNVVEGTVIKITASSYDAGIVMNDAETVLPKDKGTDNYTITITKENAGIIKLTPKKDQFYIKSIVVDPPASAVLEKMTVSGEDLASATFSASAPTNWDADGIIKLHSTDTKAWSYDTGDQYKKPITDVNGETIQTHRIKSNGAAPYITIDLTEYAGTYEMTMHYAASGTSLRTISVAEDGAESTLFSQSYESGDQQNSKVDLAGGKVYKIYFTSNAFNFYGISIEPKA